MACISLFAVSPALAQPYGRYHYRGYGYGPPPVYGYPPVVVAPPPPVVVAPTYAYPPPPGYVTPPPAYVAPAPVYAPPVYAPPAYGYGVIGPRNHFGFGYAAPGVGVYIGR